MKQSKICVKDRQKQQKGGIEKKKKGKICGKNRQKV